MKRFFSHVHRFSLIAMVALFVVAQVSTLLVPRVAHAQLLTASPDLISQNIQSQLSDFVKGNTESAFVSAIASQLVNLMLFTVNQLAYTSAVWVASGGPGETPLYTPEQISDYFRSAGAAVAVNAIDNIKFENITNGVLGGYGIQTPDDPNYLAFLREGIKSAYLGDAVDTEFNSRDFTQNLGGFLVNVYESGLTPEEKNKKVLTSTARVFATNDFSAGLQIYATTLSKSQEEARLKSLEQVENDGFNPQTDATSGRKTLPASYVASQLERDIARAQNAPSETAMQALSDKSVLLQIGGYAANIFTNTLLSELTKKMYSGLFAGIGATIPSNPFSGEEVVPFGRDRAQQAFKSILAFTPIQVTDYNLLSRLSACPSSLIRNSRELYSCAIDTSFASAVSRANSGVPLTLAEAMDEGYLNGGWPLIPSSDTARNQDPKCYTYGFCHTNLVKLRKARIIPVGWEMAAESPQNTAAKPVTLRDVMEGFHDCNENNERDDQHPWCHLVDPNWILKAPASQCRTLAYGQLLEASGTENRLQECVDIQTCVAEDGQGNCVGGYGYCTREKNVWNFRGDSCPEQYASCQSFEMRNGRDVEFLTNTVDFADCGADSVGCTWYATEKRVKEDGTFDWPVINDVALADASKNAYKNRLYFNAEVEGCNATEGGCSEVAVRTNDLSLNLVQNSGFELDKDQNTWPDAWLSSNWSGLTIDTTGTTSRSGNNAVKTGGSSLYQYGVVLNQSRFYALSFFARQGGGATSTAVVMVKAKDANGDEDIDFTGTSIVGTGCSQADSDGNGSKDTISFSVTPAGTDYERFTCLFTVPPLTNAGSAIDAEIQITAPNVFVDDIQLEQNTDETTHHIGYSNATLAFEFVKLPPSYLGCDGSPDDAVECANYAQICRASDVGCEEYAPTNGDPDVTGVVSPLDSCPQECAGYDTFMQEPTRYEPNGEFPLYLIPQTARACSAEAVGCDQFTNLDTEATSYFTYLRACVTPTQASINTRGDNAAVYYTWEGSDESGFQLKVWNLLESDLSGVGYTNYAHASGFVEANPGAAPCTNFTTDETGIQCHDDMYTGGAINADGLIDSVTDACDEHSDIFSNPDCREFYDAAGSIHYRLWSETVTVDAACSTFRKTDIAGLGKDTNGNGDDDGMENCTDAGGFFDTETNICRFFGFADESNSCNAAENGCRQYTGGRSNNSRSAYTDLFESGTLSAWDTAAASAVTLSNESIASDGHSLRTNGATVWTFVYNRGSECTDADGCDSTLGTLGGSCVVRNGEQYCGTLHDELFTGKTYTLSFWAKGTGSVSAGFDVKRAGATSIDVPFVSGLALTPEWKRYSFGPLNITAKDLNDFGDGTVLAFTPISGATIFLDNVVLREGEQDITIIKNSWVTPSTCDANPEGQLSPQYHLGCSEYSTQTGSAFVRSFSQLCSPDAVGCTGYFTTAQSNNPYGETKNARCRTLDGNPASSSTDCYLLASGSAYDTESPLLCTIQVNQTSCLFDLDFVIPEAKVGVDALSHIVYGPEAAVVPADTDVYAIVGAEDRCSSAASGCTELGAPKLSADQSRVDAWDTVFLMNDPDNYDDILCSGEELYCEEFRSQNNGTFYFKNPGSRTCEYKTDVNVNGTKYSGWFVSGTSEFCYGTGTCTDDGSACSTDAECRAATGNCSESGLVCSSDLDCGATEFCSGLSDATCNITTGSYIIGGTFSGAWRNGDVDYNGWAATCPVQWNGCSEFQDPLDVKPNEVYGDADGEAYFFVNNNRLDENDLLGSQRCNGRVSQSLGCGLFNDTGDPSSRYNASATYILSEHADDLLGDQPFSLVNPIDCSAPGRGIFRDKNGEEVDLCANRCGYDRGAIYDVTDRKAAFKLGRAFFGLDPQPTVDDLYVLGGSCYTNSDCPAFISETGNTVKGYCTDEYISSLTSLSPVAVSRSPMPRLENDTNRVLKVNRDRTCSEWLNCASSSTVWDADSGSYRTVCDSIALCTEHTVSGDSSFCSEWKIDDPAAIFDTTSYTGRDVSWYGEEYSGYTIPGTIPIQHLSQENVAAKTCQYEGGFGGALLYPEGTACVTDADCSKDPSIAVPGGICKPPADPEFRLAFNAGTCDVEFGESCTVGYCENNGSACSNTSQCSDGAPCITGQCYRVSGVSCSSDLECAGNEACISGQCAADAGAGCGIDFACTGVASGATCFPSVATKVGSCFNNNCLLTLDGKPYQEGETEVQVCRAQPEMNSPFPNTVVDTWSRFNIEDGTFEGPTQAVETLGRRARPYNTRAGFDNVQLCAPGEVCECSYKKIGTSSGTNAYIGITSKLPEIEASILAELRANTQIDTGGVEITGGKLGICSGGDADGAFCLIDQSGRPWGCGISAHSGVSDTAAAFSGTCNAITKEDTVVGLEGYCLERDTGINMNGDQNLGACLTWYPVDQLEGSTDLFAKSVEAGYFKDTDICTDARLFVDVSASLVGTGTNDIACAELPAGSKDCTVSNSDDWLFGTGGKSSCAKEVACPAGFYAIVGQCAPNPSTGVGNYAQACSAGTAGDADCPFVCVPENGYHNAGDDAGKKCAPPTQQESTSTTPKVVKMLSRNNRTTVYAVGRNGDAVATSPTYQQFDELVNAYTDCTESGLLYDQDFYNRQIQFPCKDSDITRAGGATTDCDTSAPNGYRSLYIPHTFYPACQEVTQATTLDEGYAWTDRLLNSASEFSIVDENERMRYSVGVAPTPFGTSAIDPESVAAPERPLQITACYSPESRLNTDGVYELSSGSRSLPIGSDQLTCEFGELQPKEPEIRSYSVFASGPVLSGGATPSVQSNRWFFEDPADQFIGRITQVFANIGFGMKFVWDESAKRYNELELTSVDGDDTPALTTDLRNTGFAPTVWSVDLNNCNGSKCAEGTPNRITVNGQQNGNIEGPAGFARADVRFFAAADKNQLPLRRVIVDWQDDVDGEGDYSGSAATDNFYKNRRGLVAGSSTRSYCDTGEEWGMTGESCDPNYFTYQHNYYCSEYLVNQLEACSVDSTGNVTNSPCRDTIGRCAYRPRVHVRDNWGWCTGVCTANHNDSTNGCFTMRDLGDYSRDNECNYLIFPEFSGQNKDPWIYYDGTIYIEP